MKPFMTRHLWSDRDAFEVLEVISPKRAKIRQLNAFSRYREGDPEYQGMGHQDWLFIEDRNRPIITVTKRKNGHFHEMGQSMESPIFTESDKLTRYKDWSF
jgi:hypothetical protein